MKLPYRILGPNAESMVLMQIKFKDTEGENVGRTESFWFTQREWARWMNENEDSYPAFEEKYHVSMFWGGIVHDPNYIMEIYNK